MSKRQKQHTHPSLSQQVRSNLLSILEDTLPLGIQGRNLTDETVWDLLLYASVTGTTIENACQELEAVPSGTTVRSHLQNALGDVYVAVLLKEDALNKALQAQVPKSLKKGFSKKAYEIAIDLTEIAYHGKAAQQAAEIRRSKAKSGTSHFHMYATLAVVHNKARYTLALTYMWQDDSPCDVVQRLIKQVRSLGLSIQCAYLDKGFSSIDVLRLLKKHRIPYLIPIPPRGRSGGIRTLFVGKKSYRTTYTFHPKTPWAYTTQILIIRRLVRKHFTWLAFAVYGRDHIHLRDVFDRYRRRFAIETSYRQMNQTRAKTTSRNPVLRLLLIGLALMICNAYITLRSVCGRARAIAYGGRSTRLWMTLKRMITVIQRSVELDWDAIPSRC